MFDSFDVLLLAEILKFLELNEITLLQTLNHYFLKLFPQKWLVDSLILHHSTDSTDQIDTLNMLIFLRYFFASKLVGVKTLNLTTQMRKLKVIDILFMDDLESLDIDSIVSLEHLFISRCKNLKHLNVSSGCEYLKSITFTNTSVENFEIKKSWSKLSVLDFSQSKVQDIVIPETCAQLVCIESSNSALKTCVIKPILEKSLFISFYKNTHAHLDIFTHEKNVVNTNINVFSAPIQTFEIKFFET
jgi:hypothetical protein